MSDKVLVDDLFTRYTESLKPVFFPVFVLHVIAKLGKASSNEIKSELQKFDSGGKIEYNYTSYYRLMGKMEHDYKVIEPCDVVKDKGPARIYYRLTPAGKELLQRIRREIIEPLKKIEN